MNIYTLVIYFIKRNERKEWDQDKEHFLLALINLA